MPQNDLTLETPLRAPYQTIGRAGVPPSDQSGMFAIILTLAAVLIVPIGLAPTVLG